MSGDGKITRLGRYEVGDVLGRGGMGIVYKGHDTRLGRDVALKTIRADALTSPGQSEELVVRLRREAGSAARLSHPNVITIFDIDEADGYVFVAMELLKGRPLDQILAERTAPDLGQVALMIPICEALQHLHTHGIIHRDLKPANIMVLPDGLVKLMDFGIAKDLMSNDITQTGAVMGTPVYMAPEQFLGEAIDARSDLFAAGVILFDICCRDRPFPGNTPMAIMQQVINEGPQSPRALNPSIPASLEAALLKSLARDRNARFQNAEEMGDAIEHCLADVAGDAAGRPRKTMPVRRSTSAVMDRPAAATTTAEPELDELETLPPPVATTRPTPVATTKGARGPMLAAIGAVLVVAIGVGGVIALRGSSTTAVPGAEPPIPSTQLPTDPVATTPEPVPSIVIVSKQWGEGGDGALVADGKEYPINGTRVMMPSGTYDRIDLTKPCVYAVPFEGIELPADSVKDLSEAAFVRIPDCP